LPFAPRPVPGAPKRFAQGIGAVVSVTAAVLALGLGLEGAAYAVLGLLIVAAGLEAVLGFCIGCRIFALLVRTGVLPDDVCERCANIGLDGRFQAA
jgi:cation transporter-like permease